MIRLNNQSGMVHQNPKAGDQYAAIEPSGFKASCNLMDLDTIPSLLLGS